MMPGVTQNVTRAYQSGNFATKSHGNIGNQVLYKYYFSFALQIHAEAIKLFVTRILFLT